MQIQRIYIGGWFQRTTLHLSEVWEFFHHGTSSVDLPANELSAAHTTLEINSVKRESELLEYIDVSAAYDIDFRIYEDGLIVLEKPYKELISDFATIRDYYEHKLSPALSLIFSKGAPVPKELANIKTILPYIVSVHEATSSDVNKIFATSNEEIYSTITTQNIEVHRSHELILINNLKDEVLLREIIESQIFFREFKSQLHRYLTIHRVLWEKIKSIKERGSIKGTEVDELRNQLSLYQKTINLIGARIDQMPAYVRTRQQLTHVETIDESLQPLFQFKFETLLDTHQYIKHLWTMTSNYLSSAIETFTELQTKSTKNTISSLQLITTLGVVAGIFGYLGRDSLPTFTSTGLIYFSALLFMTWLLNGTVSKLFRNKTYDIESKDIEKEIK